MILLFLVVIMKSTRIAGILKDMDFVFVNYVGGSCDILKVEGIGVDHFVARRHPRHDVIYIPYSAIKNFHERTGVDWE